MSSSAHRRNTAKRWADFLIERTEAADLVQALRVIAHAGDDGGLPLHEVAKIGRFASAIDDALKSTNARRVKVRLTKGTWQAMCLVNCDLTLNSPYIEDDDHEESKAIDLVGGLPGRLRSQAGQLHLPLSRGQAGYREGRGVDMEHRDL